MKNLKLLMIVAISAILFSGCAKDPMALFGVDRYILLGFRRWLTFDRV